VLSDIYIYRHVDQDSEDTEPMCYKVQQPPLVPHCHDLHEDNVENWPQLLPACMYPNECLWLNDQLLYSTGSVTAVQIVPYGFAA
jgi:hypothetical protein